MWYFRYLVVVPPNEEGFKSWSNVLRRLQRAALERCMVQHVGFDNIWAWKSRHRNQVLGLIEVRPFVSDIFWITYCILQGYDWILYWITSHVDFTVRIGSDILYQTVWKQIYHRYVNLYDTWVTSNQLERSSRRSRPWYCLAACLYVSTTRTVPRKDVSNKISLKFLGSPIFAQ